MSKKIAHTIAVDARLVSAKVVVSRKGKPAGKKRAIRKKCSAIFVGLKPDIQHRSWYIM
jgi:hypothetical protein